MYNINSEDTEIPFPVIVICAENNFLTKIGYNSQGLYKKNIMFRNLNLSEMIKTVKGINNNSEEFWYSQDDLLDQCALIDGTYYGCKFGYKAQETETIFFGQKIRSIVIAVKGSLDNYYISLNIPKDT